jgi:hypothetical protein
MSKTWVLDTETKGTGAEMVPLEKTLQKERIERDLALVELDRPARPPDEPEPLAPLAFKVVDVMGARVVGEDIDVREAVELLGDMSSPLDARIYVRPGKTGRWRLLTLDERKVLWRFRRPAAARAGK